MFKKKIENLILNKSIKIENLILNESIKQEMLLKAINEDKLVNIKNKIDIFTQQTNSLMNKQELLLKAINEDRLVITKILEHLEELEKKGSKK